MTPRTARYRAVARAYRQRTVTDLRPIMRAHGWVYRNSAWVPKRKARRR